MPQAIPILPNSIPVLDQNNNFTPAWYIFIQNMWLRNGGAISQTNDELIAGQLDDAGTEELKSDLYAMRDEQRITSTLQELQQEVYALRDQSNMQTAIIQGLIDDLSNSPSVQQGYDYNPALVNITGGSVDSVPIGATTASTGKFTDITNGNAAALIKTSVALNNGAAAAAATLLNAPVAGNPTKWVTINDNGTNRQIPCW